MATPAASPVAAPERRPLLGRALRQALVGYGRRDLVADLLAGLVVGTVAVPLSMALAIASGVAPQHGLYTAIVAGGLIPLVGGSRFQVSGPTAAFVVILAPISARHGLAGLALASAMAGVILLLLGVGKLGRLAEFVPYPVTTGFTAGIAVVIATLQLRDFFGLPLDNLPDHFLPRLGVLLGALPDLAVPDLAIGVLTLVLLVVWPRLVHAVPAPLAALALGGVAAWALAALGPGWQVATIDSRFSWEIGGIAGSGIPPLPPLPVLPWNLPGPDGAPVDLTFDLVRELLPAAFAIAMLGAIESLLSAVVADGLGGGKHDPDGELVGQGIGNLVAPFFGGIAATGAIARTATNIRAGGRTPIAGVAHAVVVLLAVVALAPLLGYLPMASLAALLLTVAWRMSEYRHLVRVTRRAPRQDVLVLWVCLTLTVVFDMVVAVSVGIVLAALLFMGRMAQVAEFRLLGEAHEHPHGPFPPGMLLFEVAGPLFFGAVQRAMAVLERIGEDARTLVLDLSAVPALDATGAVNLESALERLRQRQVYVVLAGIRDQPLRTLLRSGLRNRPGVLVMRRSLERGIADARAHLEAETRRTTPPPE